MKRALVLFMALSALARSAAAVQPPAQPPAPAAAPAQMTGDMPEAFSCRVRLLKATTAAAAVKATPFGSVAIGQWSAWKPVKDLFGKGHWISVGFEGCKDFSCEFQLAAGGKLLKTLTEAGFDQYAAVDLPRDLLDKGADPASAEVLARCETMSAMAAEACKPVVQFFKGRGKVPERYTFESFVHGLGIGFYLETNWLGEDGGRGRVFSNLDAAKQVLNALRVIGYNSFVWEKNFQRADKAGMADQFNHRLTFHHYGPPWYKLACPFDPQVESNRQTVVKEFTQTARKYQGRVKETWLVWGDEIGVAAKNNHIVGCPACAAAYRDYLKGLGLQPSVLGKASWEEIAPFDGEAKTPEETAAGYYTFQFWTYATARAYEPATKALKDAGVGVYPLMGSVLTMNGHSLDFFQFYQSTPSTAIAWETSNRDPRAWQWDAYMADITRAINVRHNLPILVYVKPHRGATVQRLLGIASRGVKNFDWYDDETKDEEKHNRNYRNQGVAARILGAAEDVTFDAVRVPEKSGVALLSSRTAQVVGKGGAQFQDAKWVWSALRHDGVVVDITDESLIETGDLEGRTVLYVIGNCLRQKSFEVIRDWVRQGGTLWTDISGIWKNEFGQPIAGAEALTGQKTRTPEIWGTDPGYKSTALGAFGGLEAGQAYEAPSNALITLKPAVADGQVMAAIGREAIEPAGSEILGTFADGKPAAIQRIVGKGKVCVVGTYAGLSYSAKVRRDDFDMGADFDLPARRLVTFPALGAPGSRPAVSSVPTVETVMVKNRDQVAIFLMNWTFKGRDTVPQKDLHIHVEGSAAIRSVTSAATGAKVPFEKSGDGVTLTLPELAEGDILTLAL